MLNLFYYAKCVANLCNICTMHFVTSTGLKARYIFKTLENYSTSVNELLCAYVVHKSIGCK